MPHKEPNTTQYDTTNKVETYQKTVKSSDSGTEAAAVWVPDAHADYCTMPDCNNKFTFINRRHHCRTWCVIFFIIIFNFNFLSSHDCTHTHTHIYACKLCDPSGTLACSSCSKYKLPSPEVNQVEEHTNSTHGGGEEDDSSDDEFQDESNALHKVECYIDSDDIDVKDVFSRFGHGVGSYLIIPANQNDKSEYTALKPFLLYLSIKKEVYISGSLFTKKKKDFADFNELVENLGKEEKIVGKSQVEMLQFRIYFFLRFPFSWHNLKYIYNICIFGGGKKPIRGLKNYPRAKALFDYHGEVSGDLSLKAGDIIYIIDKNGEEGWWTGVIDDRQGLFPSTYVQPLDNKPIPSGKSEPNEGDILVAKFDYDEGGQGELSFRIGDKITFLNKDESGWWLGKLEKNNTVGWFPPDLTTSSPGVETRHKPKLTFIDIGEEKSTIDSLLPSKNNPRASSKINTPVNINEKTTTGTKNLQATSAETQKKTNGSVSPVTKRVSKNSILVDTDNEAPETEGVIERSDKIISYKDLKNKNFDDAINKQKLEMYLSDEEFKEVFKCSREDFAEMPVWKQRQRKKAVDLF
ncbi:intersectin-like protein [Reticulomyxa filosa]|uniref:Intersectin-like protein n=1 Tax=Reticulomyxa filosa TaxID=46433 RepID=X6M3Z4_RETFI|nr:intersectin-like protein [Reticulomyxa filosa]|eukprot:ETO08192.1 intersectin-like protein [Reticulomyxa filosa]